MKRTVILIAALLFVPLVAQGDIPPVMSYQGVLRDASGIAVPDDLYEVVFHLYDVETGGTPLWSESQTVTVEDGVMNVLLGSVASLQVLEFEVPYWLGIEVAGEPELVPRTPLTSAPYAARAAMSITCDEPDDDWTIAGDDIHHDVGRVGIGISVPMFPLHVLTATGYSGVFDGGLGVYVNGRVEASAFRMQPGAASGYVLTADGSGVGTWQPTGTGSDSDWTIAGSDMYSGVSGRVGIGQSSPTAKLDVLNDTPGRVLNVQHASGSSDCSVNFERTVTPAIDDDVLQLKIPADSPVGCQFLELERGGDVLFRIDGDGYLNSTMDANFDGLVFTDGLYTQGKLYVTGSDEYQAEFVSSAATGGPMVLRAVTTGTGDVDIVGVYGESYPQDWYGIGVMGRATYMGVTGIVIPTGTLDYYGVSGYVSGGTGTNIGVKGTANIGAVNYGVYGSANGSGVTKYAGWFEGDVNITGTLYGGTPVFRIDHPLDPLNKYLVHSGVESDEMMNIYNGNATLDARGEATVEMPNWFEALNRDFRYQLTAIGAPGPNLYVAEMISGNRFTIAGGEPGSMVSWQVTGVRHDPVAAASRVSVEVDKKPHEVGKYMNPEAYGRPATAAVGYVEDRPLPQGDGTAEPASPPARD